MQPVESVPWRSRASLKGWSRHRRMTSGLKVRQAWMATGPV